MPLTKQAVSCVRRFLLRVVNKGVCNIKVDDAELVLWKRAIPAWVERCREWDHRFSCDYKSGTQTPLSLEKGENPLCSCAEGSLSTNTYLTFPIGELFLGTPFVQPYRRVSPFHMLRRSSVWLPKRNRLNQNISNARLAVGTSL
jgi:hypothetical protein